MRSRSVVILIECAWYCRLAHEELDGGMPVESVDVYVVRYMESLLSE